MENDIQVAHQSLVDFQNTQIANFNPDHEVVTTVTQMLQNRMRRLDREDEFNEQLKDLLLARSPEATWSEIAQLLSAREQIENNKVTGILAPFIPKDGERVPLLDHDSQRTQKGDSKILQNADKDKLQAVEALSQFIDMFNKKKAAQIANASSVSDEKADQP